MKPEPTVLAAGLGTIASTDAPCGSRRSATGAASYGVQADGVSRRPSGPQDFHLSNSASASASASVLLLLLLCGCASYQFGSRSLFRDDVRTVYVPVARNDTFRHDLGPRLTEAVIRQIELRTPYKVTGDPAADSTLSIVVTSQTKGVLTRAASNEPRALDAIASAAVSWTDRRGNPILQNQISIQANLATELMQDTRFVPEAGQSIQSALQDTIDDLADQIVSQMELRW